MGKKTTESNSDSFVGIFGYIKGLEKENRKLANDNKELAKKLDSKRYKLMDVVVDSAYRLFKKDSKKKKLIDENKDVSLKYISFELPERRVIKNRIDIINVNFYDWDGRVLYKGGAERYVFDLACLVKKMGFKPRILQCSNVFFEKKYRGIEVIGIGAGDRNDMRENSFLFAKFCRDAELLIASPLELACEIKDVPTIGINHGINFDGDWNRSDKASVRDYAVYIDALRNVKKCVCVDTNFINWTRTIDYKSSLKEKYIPNYVDAEKFAEIAKKKRNDKVVFVYPRRIYNARGADIAIEAFDEILKQYKDRVIVRFVGQVDNQEIGKKLDALMKKYEKNVFHYEYDMEEMPKAYEGADVVLVPTRYCEGTSLSCIEGMVSGAAIITTDVGGLPNLVIDGYNGKLISPVAEDLERAMKEMIDNPEERKQLAKNGQLVAKKAFNKNNWDKKWKQIIDKAMAKS